VHGADRGGSYSKKWLREETMISGNTWVVDIWQNTTAIPDMRTAAYVCAIKPKEVATSYAELGIFPIKI